MSFLAPFIQIADSVTKSLGFQGTCTLQAWRGQTGNGTEDYAPAVSFKAVIDLTKKQRPTSGGRLVTVIATLTALEPIADTTPNAGQTRQNPIDPRDIIVLPDGTTGPILDVPGAVMDPETSRPFFNTITLGEVSTAP